MNKFKKSILILTVAVFGLAACTTGEDDSASRKQEQNAAQEQLDQFLVSQPVPKFNWSQLRQNLIEIETAQANTTATTSFMFLLAGVGDSGPMVHSCPSIGFPIPATYQLTNPEQTVSLDTPGEGGAAVTVSQLESTGVYTGDTTGTYVMCVDPQGDAYAFYHEGYVATVTGPAHWDIEKGEVVMDGTSSAEFTVTK